MANEPLANKYRPNKFSDMVGQETPVTILTNSLKDKDIHHAYIFSGMLGSGKTTAARIFAACLNSPNGPCEEPDLEDPIVKKIFSGECIDVKEIDGASNRSIDDIRELKTDIGYRPMECLYKVIILDEAHAVTGHAAEAALKMIEEPPDNVVFILCTTEPHKLKDTIHSRCISLNFGKIHWSKILRHIGDIASREGLDCDDDALRIIARKSRHSMRNALQNLQSVAAYAGKGNKITVETAQNALQAFDDTCLFRLIDCIIGGEDGKPNASEAMKIIDEMLGTGRDAVDVLEELVLHLRNLMIARTCRSTSGLMALTEEEIKNYSHQVGRLDIFLIIEMIDFVGDIKKGMALNTSPQTLLEQFVVKSIMANARLKNKNSVRSGEKAGCA